MQWSTGGTGTRIQKYHPVNSRHVTDTRIKQPVKGKTGVIPGLFPDHRSFPAGQHDEDDYPAQRNKTRHERLVRPGVQGGECPGTRIHACKDQVRTHDTKKAGHTVLQEADGATGERGWPMVKDPRVPAEEEDA